jgi:hypothetical protein
MSAAVAAASRRAADDRAPFTVERGGRATRWPSRRSNPHKLSKRWAAAMALALGAHAAVIVFLGIVTRGAASRARTPGDSVVELETLSLPPPKAPPIPVAPPVEPAPPPEPRHATHAHARASAPAVPAPAVPEAETPAKIATAPTSGILFARPSPSSSSTSSSSPSSPPPRVDLQLKHDPLAALTAEGDPADALPPPAGSLLTLPSSPSASAPNVHAGSTIETPTLRGQVRRDGALAIRDKSPVSVSSDLAAPGTVLKDWLKDPKKHAESRDGTAALVRGSFDGTDTIMRALGQDPYRAERMKMLDATREQRLAMAARDRAARQHEQLRALPAQLRTLWADQKRPAKERRQALFTLWDECEEAAPGDDRRGSAGETARAMIVAFIRDHVAEGSADGYGHAELVALNAARDSRQRFDPYRAPSSPL